MSQQVFDIFLYCWIGIAVILFPVLLKVTAPYGRHSKTNWGPMIDNRLGWFFMEIPALLVFLIFVIRGKGYLDNVIFTASLLWTVHYTHRAIIFPLRIKTKGKKMPVVIMLLAVFFNLFNGFFNGYWFGFLSPDYSMFWTANPRFMAGLLLFVTGFFINQYHDRILIRLRKKTTNGYVIPKGGLFRLVSCPNFLGEIIEWGGFALLTWCLPALSFFLWTFVNLVPRALDHHKWYRKTFENYPPERKAVIPGVI
ncbi:MAG: DUF1295 domain-containing protein [Bacteroidales bacterium]|nr:DUF1295 domain-containing protein [Bacteroidales bacterium]